MLQVRDAAEVIRALGEKVVGLNLEIVGALTRSKSWKDAGQFLQYAGSQRLRAVDEEGKAAGRQAEARAHETKQRAYQSNGDSPNGSHTANAHREVAARGRSGAM